MTLIRLILEVCPVVSGNVMDYLVCHGPIRKFEQKADNKRPIIKNDIERYRDFYYRFNNLFNLNYWIVLIALASLDFWLAA